MAHYTKSYSDPSALVALLKCRGLGVDNEMKAKLRWLFVDFPEIELRAMGFQRDWELEPLWR